jgi:5-carboxymethyl-2-hydroxymuconate isomerase
MPQLTLEYSNNLIQRVNNNDLFSKLHQFLNKLSEINIENCKSRTMG